MLTSNNKTSILVPSQLPGFIRDDVDYTKFVSFIQAYYEWMEQTGQVLDISKNLLQYSDIDETTEEFLEYFVKDFLPSFPKEALIDKRKALKIAKELYGSKGIPSSYEFLFRLLYNNQDFDIFYTKDAVLKASAGKWYVTKSLKLSSLDPNWLITDNYRIFGETTKSIAVIEKSIISGNKTEIFISDIQRLFQSGEFVRVVDADGQDVLFDGEILRSKVVGQISSIRINPLKRGLLYEPGDPVIIYGGLSSSNGIGAVAEVGTTTSGSIQRINTLTGGFGYTNDPTTLLRLTNAPGAIANVGSVNPDTNFRANVSLIANNVIQYSILTTIGNTQYSFLSNNITSNANTRLIDALSFTSLTTFPISSVIVNNGGGGITRIPTITAVSTYTTDQPGTVADLKSLGILAPIQISNSGTGYQANDIIVFTGGSGVGAFANVITVSANGSITKISYVPGSGFYPTGGMGYKSDSLPNVVVQSANVQASNASIFVPGILGDGATFSAVVDRAGSITTINILNFGEDYISAPNVSLKVADIVISNVTVALLPQKGDIVYQGANVNVSTYRATVNSISLLTSDNEPTLSKYNLQVFEYTSYPNSNLPIKVDQKDISMLMANTAYPANTFYVNSPEYNQNGIKIYGDATARATAQFLNGLVIGQGQYLNSQGQPSSFDVLQSDVYNNFTYQITLEKEISKYRQALLSLLHPAGMKVLGRYAMRSNNALNFQSSSAGQKGQTLYFYTNDAASNVTMNTSFTNFSTNILQFNNLGTGVNIADFIFANSTIVLSTARGPNVVSEIASINTSSNTVTLTTNTWLTFGNVAYVSANSGSNTINIRSLTNAYSIINNGNYSNTAYPFMDIAYVGDQILVANNTAKTIQSIDYINGIITLTTNLSANANSLMSVKRTYSAGGTINKTQEVIIYGPKGLQYYPELITESGETIITEDGRIILLG
jgi:hypothetical protein